MIFKQYYLNRLAHASFLIGDESTQAAVAVDPQRDVDQYIEDARKWNLEIRHVFLTHCHADFIAGHLELRDRQGARIHLGAQAKAEFEFAPMKDGDVLDLEGSAYRLSKPLGIPRNRSASCSMILTRARMTRMPF